MSKVYTLDEFIELFRDINKITGIYFDPDKTLCNKLAKNQTESVFEIIKRSGLPNILTSDEYVEMKDDEYILNKYKIFEDHRNDIVRFHYYIIAKETESLDEFQELELDFDEGLVSDDEYIERICNYADSCIIVLTEKDAIDINEPNFLPPFTSTVDCIVMMDVDLESDDCPDHVDVTNQTLLGILPDKTDLDSFLSERIGYYTAVYEILKGHLVENRSQLYYTDDNGGICLIGSFNLQYSNNEEEEENDEA